MGRGCPWFRVVEPGGHPPLAPPRHSVGAGQLYQGTDKSFPIQQDVHFLTVRRYVERNPLRAKLVKRAVDWRWSSLGAGPPGEAQREREGKPILTEWPVDRSGGWAKFVNEPQTMVELDALREAARRGRPFGSAAWQGMAARRLGLESTMRKAQEGEERKIMGLIPFSDLTGI